jgi:hypothetical protein
MGYPTQGMRNVKSIQVDGVLTADDKRSIVAMLENDRFSSCWSEWDIPYHHSLPHTDRSRLETATTSRW